MAWGSNPLDDIGQAAGDVWGAIRKHPLATAGALVSGPVGPLVGAGLGLMGESLGNIGSNGSKSGETSAIDNLSFINQYLQTVADSSGNPVSMTPQQIISFLNERTGKDFSKASKTDLLTELGKLHTNMGWQDTPGGPGTGQSSQNPYSPMAFQQFVQSTVMPYLQQTESMIQRDIKNQSNDIVPGLAPQYASIIKQGNQDSAFYLRQLDAATRNQIAWEMDPRNQLMQQQGAAIAKNNQAAAAYRAALAALPGGGQQQVPY